MPIHRRPSVLLILLIASFSATFSEAPSPLALPLPSLSLSQSRSPPPPQVQPLELRRRSPGRRRRIPPPPPPLPPLPPPARPAAAPEEDASDDQVNSIIDALIGAGDFGSWAGIMSTAVLPLSVMLFVPKDDAVSGSGAAASGDPFMLPYHVIPQRLTFPQLLQFRTQARLPTLLPGKTLVVTNNSRLKFTIDGSPVTMPDLYSTATFTVHGVSAVFNYSVYGNRLNVVPKTLA